MWPVVWMQCYFSQEGLKPLNAAGASAEGSFTNIMMSGQDVFRFAVRAVPAVSLPLLHSHSAAQCDTAVSLPLMHLHSAAQYDTASAGLHS